MGKNPCFLWFPNDWSNDPQLKMARASTRGIWIDLINAMWWSPIRGVVSGTRDQLCQLGNCRPEEFDLFLCEAMTLNFANVTICNNDVTELVTVENRRMVREQRRRESTRKRVREFRSAKVTPPSNANVTTPLPVPVPVPVTKKRKTRSRAEQTIPVETEVLTHLNTLTGSTFVPGLAYGKYLRARIAEGAALQDLLAVVTYKAQRWGRDDRFKDNLNPTTLFRPENYQRYLQEVSRPASAAEPGSTLTTAKTARNVEVLRALEDRIHGR